MMSPEQVSAALIARLEWLWRGASAPARPALTHLLLRTVLHPRLAPYRRDPALPLAGQFISLDAYVDGALSLPGIDTGALVAGISPDDRRALRETHDRLPPLHDTVIREAASPSPSVPCTGRFTGALYLPALERAAACLVHAAYDTSPGAAAAFIVPDSSGGDSPGTASSSGIALVPVRPVAPDLRKSAHCALRAALRLLEISPLLTLPLRPGALLFDVCAPSLADDVTEAVMGDSLGLTMALSFLSALTGVPLPPDAAALGAIGRDEQSPEQVEEIDWAKEKAGALAPFASLLIAPEPVAAALLSQKHPLLPSLDIRGVASLSQAARVAAGPGFTPLLSEEETPPPGTEDRAAPAGEQIVFLFAEINGAAALWERDSDAMREAVAHLDRLMRVAIRREGGYIVRRSGGGEGCCLAFSAARGAFAAALTLQRGMRLHSWPAGASGGGVCIGIHSGSASLLRGDYFGPTPGQGWRVMEAAQPGQTLVSASAVATAAAEEREGDDSRAEPWILLPLGEHRLRDLSQPIALFQLGQAGVEPERFEPPRTLEARRHNLPVQLTPLFGREAEVTALTGILQGGDSSAGSSSGGGSSSNRHRLITLTGPGGVGKTRLALQAAAQCLDAFPDGVWFVPLEEAREADDVPAAIAEAAGLSEAGSGGDSAQTVLSALSGSRALLILDNFENVISGAPFVSRLLRQAPGIVCLATSRATLQVRGERRFDVPPLPVPPYETGGAAALPFAEEEAAGVAESPAVALFVERAQAAHRSFAPGTADFAVIASICRRLDGLPLAIELVAARVRQMPLPEINRRLDSTFSLVSTRLQDVPDRQRTLENALEWSYGLLSEPERHLLERLSVFAGGWTLSAAEAVSMASPETLDLLSALEEKSLVVFRPDTGAKEGRYGMLQMVQEFAARKLRERPGDEEADSARRAHARFFAEQMAMQAAAVANTPEEVAAFDALEEEIDNLRAAFETLRADTSSPSPPLPLCRFVADSFEFLRRRGYWRERAEWLSVALEAAEAFLAAGGSFDNSLLARLHIGGANVAMQVGDRERTERHLREARAAAWAAGDLRLEAEALNQEGLSHQRAKRWDEAIRCHAGAREAARRAGNLRAEAASLNNQGLALLKQGRMEAAQDCYEEAIPLCRQSGDARGLSYALNNLGFIAENRSDFRRARELYRENLHLCRTLKDAEAIAIALLNLGDMTEQMGEAREAVLLLTAAEQLLSRLGHIYRDTAAEYLARCERQEYAAERIAALRHDFARRPTAFLQQIDLAQARPLILPQEAKKTAKKEVIL